MNMHENIKLIFFFILSFEYTVNTQNCLGTNNYYYYEGSSKVQSQTFNQCTDSKRKYFLDCECKDNCYEYYKMNVPQTTRYDEITYILCYDTIFDAFNDKNVSFCDPFQKLCWKALPTDDTYYNKTEHTNFSPYKYEIVKICPNFYYIETNNNWCKDDCSKTNKKYFYRGNNQCLSSCDKIFKYYYDPENNECLDTCELRPGKPYSYNVTGTTPQQCRTGCDNPTSGGTRIYHNYNSHICLQNCNDDHSDNIYHAL